MMNAMCCFVRNSQKIPWDLAGTRYVVQVSIVRIAATVASKLQRIGGIFWGISSKVIAHSLVTMFTNSYQNTHALLLFLSNKIVPIKISMHFLCFLLILYLESCVPNEP